MIDLAAKTPLIPAQEAARSEKVLRMERINDRMAGSVPVWTSAPSARESVAHGLALSQQRPPSPRADSGLETALAYGAQERAPSEPDREYGFFDLLDIVNPLQHIPIVGTLYREVTGDEIKPVSRIVGGGVFGGLAGLAVSTVNVVVEEETGRDITGNVLALVLEEDAPSAREEAQTRLAAAAAGVDEALPGTAIAFADFSREPITDVIFWNSARVEVR